MFTATLTFTNTNTNTNNTITRTALILNSNRIDAMVEAHDAAEEIMSQDGMLARGYRLIGPDAIRLH